MDSINAADLIALLALQADWGADDALLPDPQDRRDRPPALITAPSAATPPTDLHSIADLAALRAALDQFDGCALKRTATQLVFADGPPDPLVLIIGEAPGAEEDRVGRPFVGPAGQLLDRMLHSIALDRNSVRIINTVPWRPPGNRVPSDAEIQQCLPFLWRHIALTRPRAILLLGAIAVRALLGRPAPISKIRGQWQDLTIADLNHPLPALPSFHPAYLLRKPDAKREAWSDLLTLRARIDQ